LETEFSGAIDGFGGSVRKVGPAMLTLTGPGSYTGGTLVSDGTLRVTSPGGLGLGTGAVIVQASLTSELRFSASGSAGALAITNVGGTASFAALTSFREGSTAASLGPSTEAFACVPA
jgi:autotransporter-associated beta strand protein